MDWATRIVAATLCGGLLLCGGAASAADVTVTGGFIGFKGVVLKPSTGISSFINGDLVTCPAAGCPGPAADSTFQLDLAFVTPQSSVDFYTKPFFSPTGDTHNLVAFTPGPAQDVSRGSKFDVGTFTFANGVWSGSADILFRFITHSPDPLLDGHVLDALIRMELTPNETTNTPAQNADTFSLFYNGSVIATAAVYELADSPTGSNSGSVTFEGRIGSLIPVGFANPTGGLFIVGAAVAPVPEPETATLMAVALAAGGAFLRSRRGERSLRRRARA